MFIKRKVKDVINDYENNPEGWLYLPNPKENWSLDIIGIFVDDEYGEQEEELNKLIEDGWIETVDKEMIKDVIYNSRSQNENINEKKLYDALIYFIENDAFKEF